MCCVSYKHIFGNTFSSPRITEGKRLEVNQNMFEEFFNLGKGYSDMEIFSQTIGIPAVARKVFDKCVIQIAERRRILRKFIYLKSEGST